MTNLLVAITAIGISAMTAGQLLDIASEEEPQAIEAMAKHNAHTELLNCYIKTRGYGKCSDTSSTP
jgi:hypothetical protein